MSDEQNPQDFRLLRSLTRLLVGGLLLGSNALDERMRTWDGVAPEAAPLPADEAQKPPEVDPLPAKLPPPQVRATVSPKNEIDLRHALIGLLFEGEEQLERGLTTLNRSGSFVNRAVAPFFRPIQKIGVILPGQKRFNQLAQRGQSEVDRWVSRGREEAERSRQLAQDAAVNTVDESLDYLAHYPALEELVQQQGVSLANQILEQIRGNAVSADYFFEALLRALLKRKPRYLLPAPSPAVQTQATWTLRDFRHEDLNGNTN
ncbi:MAG TPA: hypothetical protein DEH22_17405 [Chloroflexi bacterium]|nr:hypothetical protein [Chloroflexota bacterium]